MFIPEKTRLYPSLQALIKNMRRTGVSPNPAVAKQVSPGFYISDMVMYTQSNGRALIGHDEHGRLHFVSVAPDRDFRLATLNMEDDQLFSACPGMYDQADVSTFLGQVHFALFFEDGSSLSTCDEGHTSCYLDYFLPMTSVERQGIALTSMSFAPLLEPEAASAIAGLPMPGPNGAIHLLSVRNNSSRPITAQVHLLLEQFFYIDYQFGPQPMTQDMRKPFQTEWNRNALFLWRPNACALIQAQGFYHAGNPGSPYFVQQMTLNPGEEVIYSCNVVVAQDVQSLHPGMAILYRHSPLEWINLTAYFWRSRLGQLRDLSGDPLLQRSMDFVVRSILDNFNCYLFSDDGRLTVHQQGAPSHNSGRFWGIDAEPTALSVMYALPELIRPVLEYISVRNRPAFTVFPEHSLSIFVTPMILAARYVSLTGDKDILLKNPELSSRLIANARELLNIIQPEGLAPSRYSSDGLVFNRYDFGTNCKVYYVLTAFAALLESLGEPPLAQAFCQASVRLKAAVLDRMTVKGPFGVQIKGGTNLGQSDPFYLRDDLVYYDGEDSSSAMAPLYGLLSFTDPLWQNYHRFARSLFATNYDPEADTLRWFPWGKAIDGTALISAIGGSVTRLEMRHCLENMLEMGTDETGSLFWWPSAQNYVRGLTRCSQGQGAWVFQHTEQWLGLHLDARTNTLVVQPQGLYSSYEWKGARLGYGQFDIRFMEKDGLMTLEIRNLTDAAYAVRLIGRDASGVFSNADMAEGTLTPNSSLLLTVACSKRAAEDPPGAALVENQVHAANGPRLATCQFDLSQMCSYEPGIVVLPFVILSGPAKLENARLEIHVPDTFWAMSKAPRMVDENLEYDHVVYFDLGTVAPLQRAVCSIYLALPEKYQQSEVWMSGAPLAWFNAPDDVPYEMALESDQNSKLGMITATLRWGEKSNAQTQRLSFPVVSKTKSAFQELKKKLFGGVNRDRVKLL